MKEFYWSGVLVAVAIGSVKVLLASSALLSLRTRNMKQIGLYYGFMSGTYATERSSAWKFLGFAIYVLMLAPLASWLSVVSATWSWLRWRASQASRPEDVKRLQYRLSHIAMTKEQMIEWQEEMSKLLGVAGPVRTGEGDSDPLVLVLESGEWFRNLRMQPDKQMLKFYGRTPDYSSEFHSTYEYRFDGDEVVARLLDDHSEYYGKKSWDVRDGVVLEDDIRRRAAGGLESPKEIDRCVARYREQVAWHPIREPRTRFFAMTMHPTVFPHKRIAQLVRSEIQRLGTLAETASEEARKAEFEVVEKDDGVAFHFGRDWSEQEKESAGDALTKVLERLGTSFDELGSYRKRRTELLKIVGQHD